MPSRQILIVSFALGLLAAAPVFGQYRLGRGTPVWTRGQRGYGLGLATELDNNLRYGSGGRNVSGLYDTYGSTIGNSIVTSNVTGLAGFHGNINYTAPGDFRGRLGSNDIYNFERRSYLPRVGGRLAGPANPPSFSPNYSGGVSYGTPTVARRAGTGISSGMISGLYSNNGYSLDTGSAYRVNPALTNLSRRSQQREQSLALTTNRQGAAVSVQASPLKGLTFQPVYQAPPASYAPTTPAPMSGVTAPEPTEPEPPAGMVQAQTPAADEMSAYRQSLLMTQNQPIVQAPGDRLGQQLKSGALIAGTTDQAQTINQSLFRLLGSKAKPGEDTYLDMLRRIDQAGASGATTKPSDQQGTAPQRITLEQLLKKLKYKMPSIDSFVGIGDKPVDRTLAMAEQDMKGGRYFDADEAYRTILRFEPDYPPALVGQANARIGAGMYLSAAEGLQQLFINHPEMIRSRYKFPLLPDSRRLARVEMQLRKQMEAADSPPGLALVLAYLGYQQQNTAKITEALGQLEKKSPDDPLLPLLKRLWLSRPTSSAPPAAPIGKQPG